MPDLTELTVAENPLVQLPHCRSYLVFHIRTLEVLDSRPVTERDRNTARDRFEQGKRHTDKLVCKVHLSKQEKLAFMDRCSLDTSLNISKEHNWCNILLTFKSSLPLYIDGY